MQDAEDYERSDLPARERKPDWRADGCIEEPPAADNALLHISHGEKLSLPHCLGKL
jgi:hypothetical protein